LFFDIVDDIKTNTRIYLESIMHKVHYQKRLTTFLKEHMRGNIDEVVQKLMAFAQGSDPDDNIDSEDCVYGAIQRFGRLGILNERYIQLFILSFAKEVNGRDKVWDLSIAIYALHLLSNLDKKSLFEQELILSRLIKSNKEPVSQLGFATKIKRAQERKSAPLIQPNILETDTTARPENKIRFWFLSIVTLGLYPLWLWLQEPAQTSPNDSTTILSDSFSQLSENDLNASTSLSQLSDSIYYTDVFALTLNRYFAYAQSLITNGDHEFCKSLVSNFFKAIPNGDKEMGYQTLDTAFKIFFIPQEGVTHNRELYQFLTSVSSAQLMLEKIIAIKSLAFESPKLVTSQAFADINSLMSEGKSPLEAVEYLINQTRIPSTPSTPLVEPNHVKRETTAHEVKTCVTAPSL
jgi:hypothetical protein